MALSLQSAPSISAAVGGTPVVRLERAVPGGRIFAKLESLQPSGSAADRIAGALIDSALEEGRLRPGSPVIEASLGNTALALAPVCAVRGLPLTVCMPESMSLERRAALRAWGVRLELTPAKGHLEGAKARARALGAERPGALVLPQWELDAVARLHEGGLGAELCAQIAADGGRIDAFVSGIGTGGTLLGVARALRQRHPEVRIVAAVPARSGPHRLQGLAERAAALQLAKAAEAEPSGVEDTDAWGMREQLARREGLLVGPSTGAAVRVAAELARRLGAEARVYTVCWDTGERYFSVGERLR